MQYTEPLSGHETIYVRDRTSNLSEFQILSTKIPIRSYLSRTSKLCVFQLLIGIQFGFHNLKVCLIGSSIRHNISAISVSCDYQMIQPDDPRLFSCDFPFTFTLLLVTILLIMRQSGDHNKRSGQHHIVKRFPQSNMLTIAFFTKRGIIFMTVCPFYYLFVIKYHCLDLPRKIRRWVLVQLRTH